MFWKYEIVRKASKEFTVWKLKMRTFRSESECWLPALNTSEDSLIHLFETHLLLQYAVSFAEQNAVTDTLAALVYDIDATAEVLRRGSLKKKKKIIGEVCLRSLSDESGLNFRIVVIV